MPKVNATERSVLAIVQARCGSTRLPQKILCDLAGEPMLQAILRRAARAKELDSLLVATTERADDDAVVEVATRCGVPVHRGAVDDCLDRLYQAARDRSSDVIVRLTADNPFVDGEFIDWVLMQYMQPSQGLDYVSSSLGGGFPLGLSVEAFSFAALETAWREDNDPASREHVTPFIYRHPSRFRVKALVSERDNSAMRWTVDTPEDLEFVRKVYDHFGGDEFNHRQVLRLLDLHPNWMEINGHVKQVRV